MQLSLFEPEGTKRCGRCQLVKPVSEFHRRARSRDGLQGRCRSCNTEVAKQFHADNVGHCRARIGAWVRKVDLENQQRALEHLLTHPCVDCGEADPVVLDFDHQRDKIIGIAELLRRHVRWEIVAAEIAKCEVRCANCHRRRTAKEGQYFRYRATAEEREGWGRRESNSQPAG